MLALDQRGVEVGVGERRRGDQAAEKLDVVGDADDPVARQRVAHARQRGGAAVVVDDQLGDHRVVERRDRVALLDAGVDAHVRRLARRHQVDQLARRGQEAAVRVLGVDARLDRVAGDGELALALRQALARRNAQLPLDQVEPGDHLGHRMLDLQPRVHLHEIEAAVGMGDELDRAGADVADRLGRFDRGPAHRGAALGRHAGRGRFLEHFLVAPLYRAVALEEIDALAEGVGEDLDLDVPGLQHILLDQHAVVAERALGFALARRERGGEVLALVDAPHALAAATGAGLDEHGKADPLGLFRK